MRTTIRIDEQLLHEAKQNAIRSNKSLSEVIEDALRETIARQRAAAQRQPVRLITFTGNGLLPGVDLDHTSTLLDIMEAPNDSQ